MAADQASTTTAMTLRRHLIHRLGLAAFDVVLVAVAMMDLHPVRRAWQGIRHGTRNDDYRR